MRIVTGLGALGAADGSGSTSEISARPCSTSGGTSMPTGRGRPMRNARNASWTRPGTSAGVRAIPLHFVTVPSVALCPGTS